MTIFNYRSFSASALLLLAAPFNVVFAQDSETPAPSVHLGWVNGTVSLRHGDDGVWMPGVVDAPLKIGDYVATGHNGRVSIPLDDVNILQIQRRSEIRVDLLETGTYRIAVIKGAVRCQVVGPSTANVELGTPHVAVRATKPSLAVIAVDHGRESEITVWRGDVEVVAPHGSEWVNEGQKMTVRGPVGDPRYKIGNAITWWMRWGGIVANCVQIAASIASSYDGGAQDSSGSKSSAPSKPASSPTPTRTTPTPAQDGHRGKG